MKEDHLLELVVVSGQQAGARITLPLRESVEISDSLDSDIMLSDPAINGKKLHLFVSEEEMNVNVLSGDISLAGQVFLQGQVAKVSPYQAVTIGDTAFAFGKVGATDWATFFDGSEKTTDYANEVCPLATEVGMVDQQPVWTKSWFRFGALPITLIVVCLGVVFAYIVFSSSPAISIDQRLASTKKTINDAGFSELEISADNSGQFIVSGYIATAEEYARLERLLDSKQIFPAIELQVGERLARQIEDVYRVNGIDAIVEVHREGVAIVKTTFADTEKLAQVKAIVLKDVANLDEVISENSMPESEKDIADSSMANDPGKRIAMIVPGDSPYIVTVDKSRYYVGALLPTGHKITQITENNVLLEKNEATTSLNF